MTYGVNSLRATLRRVTGVVVHSLARVPGWKERRGSGTVSVTPNDDAADQPRAAIQPEPEWLKLARTILP